MQGAVLLRSTRQNYIQDKFNLRPDQICMVGDRLDTDILFGKDGGLKTMLVLSGAVICYAIDPLVKTNIICIDTNFRWDRFSHRFHVAHLY